MITYRSANHHPVIPMVALVDNYESDVETQSETYESDRERDELDNDESRPPSVWIGVIRGRPRGHDVGRREPHLV